MAEQVRLHMRLCCSNLSFGYTLSFVWFIAERESLSEAAWRERRVSPTFRSSPHRATVVYRIMESNVLFGSEDFF